MRLVGSDPTAFRVKMGEMCEPHQIVETCPSLPVECELFIPMSTIATAFYRRASCDNNDSSSRREGPDVTRAPATLLRAAMVINVFSTPQ